MKTANEVWFVNEDELDDMPTLWASKIDAEVYARRLYPDESPNKRYARIFFKRVLSYDEVEIPNKEIT